MFQTMAEKASIPKKQWPKKSSLPNKINSSSSEQPKPGYNLNTQLTLPKINHLPEDHIDPCLNDFSCIYKIEEYIYYHIAKLRNSLADLKENPL